MSSSAMWYKNGNFYEVPTTHIDFFLQNPELLGFTQEEKEQLCIENGNFLYHALILISVLNDKISHFKRLQCKNQDAADTVAQAALNRKTYGNAHRAQNRGDACRLQSEQLKNHKNQDHI